MLKLFRCAYFYDRELVYPVVLEQMVPFWLHHLMHTDTALFMLLEVFISIPQYPKRKAGLTGLTFAVICYIIWILFVYQISKDWVYPVLAEMTILIRVMCFASFIVYSIAFYFFGEMISNCRKAKPVVIIDKKRKSV